MSAIDDRPQGDDPRVSKEQKDQVLFFSAFARTLIYANPNSSGEVGLNQLGDILDGFGFGADRSSLNLISRPEECTTHVYGTYSYQECRYLPLPADSPTTEELQGFLFSDLAPQLEASISALDKVSPDFRYAGWVDPVDGTVTEFDYGDALVVKAATKALLAQIYIQQAYEVDIDVDAEERKSEELDGIPYTNQDFLSANSYLGQLKDASKLLTAKAYLAGALDDMLAAINAIEGEEDDQRDDLVSFYAEIQDVTGAYVYDPVQTAANISAIKADLASAQQALVRQFTFDRGSADTSDEVVIDLPRFFEGIDLRDKIPAYNGDVPGMFPDPTIGGILVKGFDLNRDLDGDSAPDLLHGYTRFSEALLMEEVAGQMGGHSYVNNTSWTVYLNTDHTFTLSWTQWNPAASGTETGTWSVDANGKLVLSNSNASSPLFLTATASLLSWDGGYFQTSLTLSGNDQTFYATWY